jgi:hypothetical protein
VPVVVELVLRHADAHCVILVAIKVVHFANCSSVPVKHELHLLMALVNAGCPPVYEHQPVKMLYSCSCGIRAVEKLTQYGVETGIVSAESPGSTS